MAVVSLAPPLMLAVVLLVVALECPMGRLMLACASPLSAQEHGERICGKRGNIITGVKWVKSDRGMDRGRGWGSMLIMVLRGDPTCGTNGSGKLWQEARLLLR